MNPISNRVFLVVAASLSFVVAVNSLGLNNLTRSQKSEDGNQLTINEVSGKAELAKKAVSFEENRGQMDPSVRYLSRSGGVMTFLTSDSAWFYLSSARGDRNAKGKERRPRDSMAGALAGRSPRTTARAISEKNEKQSLVRMDFEGANLGSVPQGERSLEGKVNYLKGSDPTGWITDVPTYGAVRYEGLYPGIDLVYYGNEQGQMEYDFEVAPEANFEQISLRFSGAENVAVEPVSGDLIIKTEAGELRHHQPIAFQFAEGGKRSVSANYEATADGAVKFRVGAHDSSIPLIIDPIVGYSTYLGGSGDVDFANSVAVDAAGNAYLAGSTNSANFPTLNPFDGTFGGDQLKYDAFVTKMNAAGTAMIYSTYLGGSNDDNGVGLAVDGSGQAHVAGFTDSNNFPTALPFQAALNGTAYDGFLSKLNSSGSGLVYSTYLGGSQNDSALGVAIGSSGSAVITGETASSNFPTVAPYQPIFGGGASDAFVANFNSSGNGLVFSTYLGGSADDLALGVAVNASGVHLAGATTSPNFPVFNAIQPTFGGSGFFDGFVTKMNSSGSGLVYSTYLGGNDYDGARDIGLDVNGNAGVTGVTASSNFPTLSAFQSTRSGTSDDVFVTRISSAGGLIYSTYLGGTGMDQGAAIAVDATGAAYVTGSTRSTNFPIVDALRTTLSGESDAFVTKVNPAGSSVEFSTYYGGSSFDDGIAIAVDSGQNAYVAGGTDSVNFPTVIPFQANRSGASDAFLLKISSSLTTITGQVFTSSGQGLRNAVVTLTDQNNVRIQSPTTSLGFYTFSNVVPGQQYVLTVSSRRYRFDPVPVTPTQSLVTINFTGLE